MSLVESYLAQTTILSQANVNPGKEASSSSPRVYRGRGKTIETRNGNADFPLGLKG